MEFWGAEVKSGEPLKVQPGDGMVIHLSQANIGEVKKEKGTESVCLFVNVDGKKLVLGTLFSDKLPQQQFDLVFDRDFELSHNWKAGSVFFYGYKATNYEEESGDESGSDFDSDEDEEDIPLVANNGKPEIKAKQDKSAAAEKVNAGKDSGKQKVKIVEPNKDVKPDEEDDDDSEDDSDDDMDSDEEMEEGQDGSDSDEDDESEDEETPKKAQSGKKRAAESATKTPEPVKKAKVTPQKTDGKKGVHVATPHPSKQAGKTPGNKSNQQTPKSGGSVTCESCKKTFGSENALQSHTKAKHSAGK